MLFNRLCPLLPFLAGAWAAPASGPAPATAHGNNHDIFAAAAKKSIKINPRPDRLRSYKYFHESYFDPHYDGRFATGRLEYPERRVALRNLLHTYLSTFADIGVETWLVHGTLMGWWWGKKILPWDSDLDVQISESALYHIAETYNMSTFHYETPRLPAGGLNYLLEINPHYSIREQRDTQNVIDARWIDTSTGLFIDITAVRHLADGMNGMLTCKDGHKVRDTSLYPLRDTTIEGVPAKIPFAFKELLETEYGSRSLVANDFEDHLFNDDTMEWEPKPYGKYVKVAKSLAGKSQMGPAIVNGKVVADVRPQSPYQTHIPAVVPT